MGANLNKFEESSLFLQYYYNLNKLPLARVTISSSSATRHAALPPSLDARMTDYTAYQPLWSAGSTADLFAPDALPLPSAAPTPSAPAWDMPEEIEGKIERAEKVLTNIMRKGMPVCVSWSAGKDSSVVLNLVLSAAAKMSARQETVPPIVITHADTGIESPEMHVYARHEMTLVKNFARQHRLRLRIDVAHPNLSDQWPVRIIGGRALPPFPGTNHDCTQDWKIKPMAKLRKHVLKELQALSAQADPLAQPEPVVLIGTRYDESAERERNMRERGESDIEIRRGLDANGRPSHLFISPIAFWDTDSVWTYLGMAQAGMFPAYSDFKETFRVYADAQGTSCVIVAEDMSRANKAAKACGARHGCSLCTAVGQDKSMENMLAHDRRYDYMRGLNELRNFLVNTRWDMDRRAWVGRTIKDGYVRIGPDAYSPAMMEELLRYTLTIDMDERHAAARAGVKPRFELVDIKQLFAIDAMWSLQAFHRPFHALKIYDEIVRQGKRYPVPRVAPFERVKELPARYLFVGQDWDEGREMTYNGLRSAVHELVRREGDGCMGNRTLASGKEVMAISTGPMLDFDVEAAYFVLDELPRLLREHHDQPHCSPTEAYHYYARLGMMTVKAGLEGEVDSMLRRSNFKVRHGLAETVDVQALWARALPAEQAGMAAPVNGVRRARGAEASLSQSYAWMLDTEEDAPSVPSDCPT